MHHQKLSQRREALVNNNVAFALCLANKLYIMTNKSALASYSLSDFESAALYALYLAAKYYTFSSPAQFQTFLHLVIRHRIANVRNRCTSVRIPDPKPSKRTNDPWPGYMYVKGAMYDGISRASHLEDSHIVKMDLDAVVASLSEEQRFIYESDLKKNWSTSRIAKELGVSVRTVESRRAKLRRKVKAAIC